MGVIIGIIGIMFVVWMIIGIIRVSVSDKNNDGWDFFCQLLMLDIMFDLLLLILEGLSD